MQLPPFIWPGGPENTAGMRWVVDLYTGLNSDREAVPKPIGKGGNCDGVFAARPVIAAMNAKRPSLCVKVVPFNPQTHGEGEQRIMAAKLAVFMQTLLCPSTINEKYLFWQTQGDSKKAMVLTVQQLYHGHDLYAELNSCENDCLLKNMDVNSKFKLFAGALLMLGALLAKKSLLYTDLKPDNLFIETNEEKKPVRIVPVDWECLMRVNPKTQKTDPKLTQGTLGYAPSYMVPKCNRYGQIVTGRAADPRILAYGLTKIFCMLFLDQVIVSNKTFDMTKKRQYSSRQQIWGASTFNVEFKCDSKLQPEYQRWLLQMVEIANRPKRGKIPSEGYLYESLKGIGINPKGMKEFDAKLGDADFSRMFKLTKKEQISLVKMAM